MLRLGLYIVLNSESVYTVHSITATGTRVHPHFTVHNSILQYCIPIYSPAVNYCEIPTDLQGYSHLTF